MAIAAPFQQTALAHLYIALFNRAPDASGFSFWNQSLTSGSGFFDMTKSFLNSSESLALYPTSQTATEFVTALYTNVFGRTPDADGLVFWTKVLDAAGGVGSIDGRAVMVSKIVELVSTPMPVKSAELTDTQFAETVMDREIFSKKTEVSLEFATQLKSDDLVLAKEVLAKLNVRSWPSTPDWENAGTPTPTPKPEPAPGPETTPAPAPETTPDPGPTPTPLPTPDPTPIPTPDPRLTFTLGTGADLLVGDVDNDTFNAPDFSGKNSINTHDNLDGGAGVDTLNATLAFKWREIPTLKNIEVVNVKTLVPEAELDLRNSTGVTQVGFADSADGSDGIIYNVGAAQLSVSNQTANAGFTGSTATTLALSLTKVGTSSTAMTTVDLAKLGAGVGTDGRGDGAMATTHDIDMTDAYVALAESKASAAVTTVNVTATGNNALTLSVADAATVTSLKVTGSGSVDFTGRALSALDTFQGGNGADKLSIANALSASSRINMGAGNDVITLEKGSEFGATINGGDGNDTIITGGVKHAILGVNVVAEQQVLALTTASGTADPLTDTVSVTIMGEKIVIAPVNVGNKIAVAAAIKAAVDAHGTLVADGLKTTAFLDVLYFTFGGKYAGVDQPTIVYDGNEDGQGATLNGNASVSVTGRADVLPVAGSVDTLTGGTGANTFVFNTPDSSSLSGAVTAVITDFKTGVDKITVTGGAAGAGHFVQAAASTSLANLLLDAGRFLDTTTQYYVGHVGSDAYLVTDLDGVGYTNVIKLAGVGATGGIAASDLIAG